MASMASRQMGDGPFKEIPFTTVLALSVVFHVFVLVIVPVATKLVWKPSKFQRPKTFQLVSAPLPLPPTPVRRTPVKTEAPKQRIPKQESKPEPSPIPAKKNVAKKETRPAKQEEAARPIEENLDELASILNEIPSPAQVSAVGDFKFHWYLANVVQKIERYWSPSTENRNVKIQVSFSIQSNGSITEPVLVRSSGNSSLDNLGLRAVKLAAPFGKLPPGFSGDRLDLNLTLIPTRK